MTYADTALNEMKECFEEMKLDYSVETLTEAKVLIDVNLKNAVIHTWFDVQAGSYGFDMLNGGSKSFSDTTSFKGFLGQYVKLVEEVIPIAKRVADNFSTHIRKNVVYDTFFGKLQTGFTIVFRTLGEDDHAVYVTQTEDVIYKAQLIRFSPDNSKYKVVTECNFTIDGDSIILHKDLAYFVTHLYLTWGGSDMVLINRSVDNESLFTFNFNDGYSICVEIKNSGINSQYYEVIRINSDYVTLCIDEQMLGSALFNMEALHDFVVKYADSNDIPLSCEIEESKEVAQKSVEESIEQEQEFIEQEPVEQEFQETEDIHIEDIKETGVEETEMNENKEVEDLAVFKIMEGEDIVAVRFVLGTSLYDIGVETMKKMGVPCDMICDSIERERRHGIKITAMERNMHTFAVNVSDDKDKCRELIERLFN